MDSEILTRPPAVRETLRPAPQGATLLLPVWGYRFVLQFLDFCLPSLLASGNVPAVAALLPTRFVVLTREDDAELIKSHPMWLALQRVCDVDVACIDDLITEDNHTTTITLAFARAVRQAREAMLDTVFFFLMSDYLFADGALRTVINRFLDGASGVVAGNFQVVAEDAASTLKRAVNLASSVMSFPPRELVAWSLGYLHPATTANIVNLGISHNAHTNRLLWRVDENTLIGRFYLIHPIAVRPEVADFVVGSSLDYSFIPEMCPSGNVITLNDSDEYFVIEMQPRLHERFNLRAGPVSERELAISLSEWTTAQHRENVAHTLVYHARDLPVTLGDTVAAADAFIARVGALLSPVPQPFRNHPYWAGAIASNRLRTGQSLGKDDWAFLLGEAIPSAGLRSFIWKINWRLFGSPPNVTRFHTRWPDYHVPRRALQDVLSAKGRLLLVSDRPVEFARWLTGATSDICTMDWEQLLPVRPEPRQPKSSEWYRRLLGSFDACLIVVTEPILAKAGEVIEVTGPLLREAAQILVMVLNDRPYHNAAAFRSVFTQNSAELITQLSWVAEVHYVPASRFRWLVYRMSDAIRQRLKVAYAARSPLLLPYGALFVFLGMITAALNLCVSATKSPPKGLWSSVFLMLRRSGQGNHRALSSGDTFFSQILSRDPYDRADAPALATRPGRVESPVPPVLNEPQLMQLRAAHYVAAKLLTRRHDIALYGSYENDCSFAAMYDVRRVTAYSLTAGRTEPFVAEVMSNIIHAHDILAGPLPRTYDAICSFTTLSSISRSAEDDYISNLAHSLSRNEDLLFLGCPFDSSTGESAVGGRKARITGRGEVRTGAALKALAERYFNCVLLFTLAGGGFFPGVAEMADYGLVVCSSRKAS